MLVNKTGLDPVNMINVWQLEDTLFIQVHIHVHVAVDFEIEKFH